jgi:hypothetical protein
MQSPPDKGSEVGQSLSRYNGRGGIVHLKMLVAKKNKK